jgi:hypothetical protein
VLFASPIVGVFRCSTKSAGKVRVLVTALCLFGGVLDGRVASARGDWELLGTARVAGQSDAVSLRAQGQVQMQDRESAGSKPSSAVSQPKSGGVREAPFLKHALLFDPDSAELSAASTNAVKRAAAWLHKHRETRILIVGFCDSSGSETCTPRPRGTARGCGSPVLGSAWCSTRSDCSGEELGKFKRNVSCRRNGVPAAESKLPPFHG